MKSTVVAVTVDRVGVVGGKSLIFGRNIIGARTEPWEAPVIE